jgi:hypothetical protein
MKYKYILEDSVNPDYLFVGAYLPNTADNKPVDFLHSQNIDEIFTWIKEMESK